MARAVAINRRAIAHTNTASFWKWGAFSSWLGWWSALRYERLAEVRTLLQGLCDRKRPAQPKGALEVIHVTIRACCCGVAKGIEWMRSERSATNGMKRRLAGEAYLKAMPKNEALLYAWEWVVTDEGGVHEWTNLPDWMQWNGVERIEDEWMKLLAATWQVCRVLRLLLVTCRTDL